MKRLHRLAVGTPLLLLLAVAPSIQASEVAPDPFDLKSALEPSGASEFVEVRLGKNLIHMAAQLVEPSDAQVAEILRGLDQVRVNVVGLDDDNREPVLRQIESLRAHLDREQWERVVTVQQEKENVCVHLKSRDAETVEGLVVSVVENQREAILVRITGNIRPAQIGEVAEALDIGPLKKFRSKLEKR